MRVWSRCHPICPSLSLSQPWLAPAQLALLPPRLQTKNLGILLQHLEQVLESRWVDAVLLMPYFTTWDSGASPALARTMLRNPALSTLPVVVLQCQQ